MKKGKKIILIIVIVIIALGTILWFSGSYIGKYFQHKYLQNEYQPEELQIDAIGSFPSEYHLKDIPWISYKESYCQSASLQMIAHYHGIEESLDYFNFLMGFSYSAASFGNWQSFMPWSDPEPGFRVAAPYLGLKRRYMVTNNGESLLKALKFYLSKAYPIRIAHNSRAIRGKKGFSGHSVVLVEYNEADFYYYETGGEDRFSEGEKGIKVTDRTLINAMRDIHERFNHPWKFSFTIFEKAEKVKNPREIWKRNGKLLIGSKWGPICQGSFAIKEFALQIEREEDDLKSQSATDKEEPNAELSIVDVDISPWDYIRWKLKAASYTRRDNAKFIKEYFSSDKEVVNAAQALEEAIKCYEEALKASDEFMSGKVTIEEMVKPLLRAATVEEKVGKIFLQKAGAGE
jgi:hypothetical protein